MQAYLTLTRRELGGFFLSPRGYIIIAAAAFLMGSSFSSMIAQLQQEPTPVPVTEVFYVTPYFWIILLLTSPMVTMRVFASEKLSGTFETLMTAPVSDLQVVLAKFSGAMIFYAIVWLLPIACSLILRQYLSDPGALDAGALGSTFLGIVLLGGLFISVGCCASAMTRSQAIAAMISLAFGTSLFLLGYLAQQIPTVVTWQAQVLGAVDFFNQMHDFARGVVDTRPVVLYVSLTLFFLFLTLRIVESRRWK